MVRVVHHCKPNVLRSIKGPAEKTMRMKTAIYCEGATNGAVVLLNARDEDFDGHLGWYIINGALIPSSELWIAR